MKFHHKPVPMDGSVRSRKIFAWLPIRCKNETRWLEKVHIMEVYHAESYSGPGYWIVTKFLDNETC